MGPVWLQFILGLRVQIYSNFQLFSKALDLFEDNDKIAVGFLTHLLIDFPSVNQTVLLISLYKYFFGVLFEPAKKFYLVWNVFEQVILHRHLLRTTGAEVVDLLLKTLVRHFL